MKNTLKQGSVRTIIFKEDDIWYATGLEFNIVSSGDTAEITSFMLDQAIKGHVESLINSPIGKLRTECLLNQKADLEYEVLWGKLEKNEPIESSSYTLVRQNSNCKIKRYPMGLTKLAHPLNFH